jgi:hypothetical protein
MRWAATRCCRPREAIVLGYDIDGALEEPAGAPAEEPILYTVVDARVTPTGWDVVIEVAGRRRVLHFAEAPADLNAAIRARLRAERRAV